MTLIHINILIYIYIYMYSMLSTNMDQYMQNEKIFKDKYYLLSVILSYQD